MISYDICLSLSDLLQLVWPSVGPSMLLQVALSHSFLWLNTKIFNWLWNATEIDTTDIYMNMNVRHFSCVQLFATLCSPPGSSVHGILQGRILEWVAIPFSSGSSQPTDHTQGRIDDLFNVMFCLFQMCSQMIQLYICVCVCVCVYLCSFIYIYVCVCVYIHIYIYMYLHTYLLRSHCFFMH